MIFTVKTRNPYCIKVKLRRISHLYYVIILRSKTHTTFEIDAIFSSVRRFKVYSSVLIVISEKSLFGGSRTLAFGRRHHSPFVLATAGLSVFSCELRDCVIFAYA